MTSARAWLERFGAPLAVAGLCALSIGVRIHVNAPRDGVAHGDTGYYLTLAQNLAQGRGFVIDYVPDFLFGPKRIPCPANTFWMPLTPVILAIGMVLCGKTFAVAQATMIVFSSLAPAVGYLLGREMFGGRRHGLVAALLAATCEGYLTAGSQPQTHGVTLVLGGLWLLLALRARRAERWLPWLGATMGLLHLNRSDGAFYFLVLALLWLFPLPGSPRWSVRGLAKLFGAYALVMLPLWVHNTFALGTPLPLGLGRAALIVDYAQTYSLPESITVESFLDAGWERIADARVKAIETNGATFLLGSATGSERAQLGMLRAHHWALLVLVWAGWLTLARARFLPVWALVGVLWTIYTLVFAPTGLASLRSSLFPVYLAFFAGAGRALEVAVRFAESRLPTAAAARRIGTGLAAGLLVWIAGAQVHHAATQTRVRVRFIHQVEEKHAALMEQAIEPLGLQDAVIMTWDVHELHVHTGLKLVMLPHEPEPVIYRVAKELGVTHVLIWGVVENFADVRPGLAAIPRTREHYELVFRDTIRGEPARIYRVR